LSFPFATGRRGEKALKLKLKYKNYHFACRLTISRPLTLREECGLVVSEKMVIRRTVDLQQVTGGWRKVHNEELNNRDIKWRRVRRTGRFG
jgi:hypothetical protein